MIWVLRSGKTTWEHSQTFHRKQGSAAPTKSKGAAAARGGAGGGLTKKAQAPGHLARVNHCVWSEQEPTPVLATSSADHTPVILLHTFSMNTSVFNIKGREGARRKYLHGHGARRAPKNAFAPRPLRRALLTPLVESRVTLSLRHGHV